MYPEFACAVRRAASFDLCGHHFTTVGPQAGLESVTGSTLQTLWIMAKSKHDLEITFKLNLTQNFLHIKLWVASGTSRVKQFKKKTNFLALPLVLKEEFVQALMTQEVAVRALKGQTLMWYSVGDLK